MYTYVRVKKHFRERLATPLEGIVYQQSPETQPASAETIIGRVLAYLEAHPEEGQAHHAEVQAIVNSLHSRGFLSQQGS